MGNVAASARDLAQFFRDLFAPVDILLPPALVASMQTWGNLTNDWADQYASLGIEYGLGLYRCGEFSRIVVPGTGPDKTAELLGHPGADWGSMSSPVCGYNVANDFGICVTYNSAVGMNCSSREAFELAQRGGSIASCLAYNAVLQLHGGPWLDCMRYEPSWSAQNRVVKYKNPECSWQQHVSACDICVSDSCAECHSRCAHHKGGNCAHCWAGFAACQPLCRDARCEDAAK